MKKTRIDCAVVCDKNVFSYVSQQVVADAVPRWRSKSTFTTFTMISRFRPICIVPLPGSKALTVILELDKSPIENKRKRKKFFKIGKVPSEF